MPQRPKHKVSGGVNRGPYSGNGYGSRERLEDPILDPRIVMSTSAYSNSLGSPRRTLTSHIGQSVSKENRMSGFGSTDTEDDDEDEEQYLSDPFDDNYTGQQDLGAYSEQRTDQIYQPGVHRPESQHTTSELSNATNSMALHYSQNYSTTPAGPHVAFSLNISPEYRRQAAIRASGREFDLTGLRPPTTNEELEFLQDVLFDSILDTSIAEDADRSNGKVAQSIAKIESIKGSPPHLADARALAIEMLEKSVMRWRYGKLVPSYYKTCSQDYTTFGERIQKMRDTLRIRKNSAKRYLDPSPVDQFVDAPEEAIRLGRSNQRSNDTKRVEGMVGREALKRKAQEEGGLQQDIPNSKEPRTRSIFPNRHPIGNDFPIATAPTIVSKHHSKKNKAQQDHGVVESPVQDSTLFSMASRPAGLRYTRPSTLPGLLESRAGLHNRGSYATLPPFHFAVPDSQNAFSSGLAERRPSMEERTEREARYRNVICQVLGIDTRYADIASLHEFRVYARAFHVSQFGSEPWYATDMPRQFTHGEGDRVIWNELHYYRLIDAMPPPYTAIAIARGDIHQDGTNNEERRLSISGSLTQEQLRALGIIANEFDIEEGLSHGARDPRTLPRYRY